MRKLLVVMMCLCLFATLAVAENAGYKETIVNLTGTDYEIPATVCVPTGEGPYPAVVMLHGTGSTRDEAGDGYKVAAPILAEKYGIATIRIDFPGNGDSTADYMQYNFHSAVADAVTAAQYMAALDEIDGNHIGIMGWSQGGTDALLACAWEPETFKSIVTWAGAPDMMLDGFFSEANYEEAKANGFFVMEFDFRDSLNVSLQWCDDVANTDVLAEFTKGYSGPVLAICGSDDDTVDPVWSEKIVAASSNPDSAIYVIEGMDHTFNVFTEEDLHSLLDAIDATGAFFAKTLTENETADSISSASIFNFYGGIEGDDLMNAINSYTGFYAVASVNPDGTPNIGFFIYGCVKADDKYYLQLGLSPNQTTANIDNGSELIAMYGCLPEEGGTYPTAGAKMHLTKVEDASVLEELLKSAPEGYVPMYYEITKVDPLG